MPRVYLTKQEQLNSRLADWVAGEMKRRDMTHAKLAQERGISQQAMSMKLRVERFSFEDLCFFVWYFQPDSETLDMLLGI